VNKLQHQQQGFCFDYSFGKLSYASLRQMHQHITSQQSASTKKQNKAIHQRLFLVALLSAIFSQRSSFLFPVPALSALLLPLQG